MYKILHVTLKKVGLKSNTYKHFLYICTSIGSLGHAAHQRLKGNRVKIPNSSRCCESHRALRHHIVTEAFTLGRHRRARQVRRPAKRL